MATAAPAHAAGTGLRVVEHTRNGNHAPEEVEVVKCLVDELLAAGATWTDVDGETYDIEFEDVLIVAAHNARGGTVDRIGPRSSSTRWPRHGRRAPHAGWSGGGP